MKAISIIEDEDVIKKILKHLGLWDVKAKPPLMGKNPARTGEPFLEYSDSQLPHSEDHLDSNVEYPIVSGEAASSKF